MEGRRRSGRAAAAGGLGQRRGRLPDRGERRLGELHQQAVVAPDDGQLVGHPQAGLPGRPDDPEGDHVRAAQDAGDPALEQALRGHHPALHGVRRALDEVVQVQVVGHQAARDAWPARNAAALRWTGT